MLPYKEQEYHLDFELKLMNSKLIDYLSFEINSNWVNLPYWYNYSLETTNVNVERVIIIIHGHLRNANDYYTHILDAARAVEGASKNIMIIAPHFLTDKDLKNINLKGNILYWSNKGWKQGNLSQNNNLLLQISSFSIIDRIIETLSDSAKFPNLKNIVVAGHSAGGQFVNRFAAGSQVQPKHIHLRYIIANPSSYLYFNQERHVPGSLDRFSIPDDKDCAHYNEYKYGLENLNQYMKLAGVNSIINQYLNREVIYLLGEEDRCSNAQDLATSCQALHQGTQRLERGIIYFNYLQHYFGSTILENHVQIIVPGVGHDCRKLFNSEIGKYCLFG